MLYNGRMNKKQINEIIYYEMTHKWVRVGTKWYREEIPLVVPPPLTPEEEKQFQEEERLAKIKCQQVPIINVLSLCELC